MCDRYVLSDQGAAEREFLPAKAWWKFTAKFNVAAQQYVPAIRVHGGQTEGMMMRWGLIPSWAEGRPTGDAMACVDMARIERSNVYRMPWLSGQRCILPALGFFEWQVQADGKSKQPFYITLNDQDVLGFAGLWDTSKGADGVAVESCTIVTMPANQLMTEIHNVKHRMPAILAKEDRETWLAGSAEEAFAVIKQYPDTHMVATPVSTRVNTPKNNDAKLIEPV